MQTHILLQRDFLLPLGKTFARWYFLERPELIVRTYFIYAKAFREIFSIVFLLKSLFKPWKNIVDHYPTKGFNLNLILQSFTLNCVTRSIGAVIRLSCVVFGLLIQVAMLVGFSSYLILWVTFPGMLLLGISYILFSL